MKSVSYLVGAVVAAGCAVSASAKVVYVVPNGEAPTEVAGERGSSWATAYGDLKAAYESLGTGGGEVWVKKGLYVLTNEITMAANIGVYGGFAGTETARSQANPTANLTLLSGDRELDDVFTTCERVWRYHTFTPIWDYSTLTFNRPTPDIDGGKYFWTPWPNNETRSGGKYQMTAYADVSRSVMDASNDTGWAFRHDPSEAAIGTAVFEGLAFTGFKSNVIYVAGAAQRATPRDSSLVIRKCRFLGCVTGAYNKDLHAAVYAQDMPVEVSDTLFDRTYDPIYIRGAGLLLDEVAFGITNCTFTYVTAGGMSPLDISCSGHPTPTASPRFHITGCTFDHNFRIGESAMGVALQANGILENSSFVDNTGSAYAPCLVRFFGGQRVSLADVEVRNCRFERNRMLSASSDASVCMGTSGRDAAFAPVAQGRAVVRDCYFAENYLRVADAVKEKSGSYFPQGDFAVCYLQSGLHANTESIAALFINCTAVSNKIEYAASEEHVDEHGHFSIFSGPNVFVNCVVKDSQFVNSSTLTTATGTPVFYEFRSCSGTLGVVLFNTVAKNDNAGGTYHLANRVYYTARSVGTGGATSDGGTAGESEVSSDFTGISFSGLISNQRGVPTIRVRSQPNARPGCRVWEVQSDVAVYDPAYNSSRPWRCFRDMRYSNGCYTSAQMEPVLPLGTADTEHLVRDVNGDARHPKGDAYGPLRYKGGMLLLVR